MIQSWFYFQKIRNNQNSQFANSFQWFFLFFSISTFLGGLTHLFYNYTGQISKIPGWIAALLAVAAIELAVTGQSSQKLKPYLHAFIAFKIIFLGILMILSLSFNYVIIQTAFMAVFISIPMIKYASRGSKKYTLLFWGIVFLLLALPFKLMGIDFHLWFNRDDISHVFMMATLLSFYKGVTAISSNYSPVAAE